MASRLVQTSGLPYFEEKDDEELEEQFSISDDTEASDDILPVLNEIRQGYDIHSHIDLQHNSEETSGDREARVALEDALYNTSTNDANDDRKNSCASCSKKVRVDSVFSLQKGQHIATPGRMFKKYWENDHKLKHLYKHHFIIKEIKWASGTRIEMEFIHFNEKDNKFKICKSVHTYDLKHDELYIIEYTHPRYTADEIVRRAEDALERNDNGQNTDEKYNILTNNCEHFATSCVCGEKESFQCQSMRKRIANLIQRLFGVGTSITKMVMKILYISSDEIATRLTVGLLVPEYVLGSSAALYLIYCILMTYLHWKEFREGYLCKTCFKEKSKDLWITFAVFGITSLVTFVIMTFAVPILGNPIGIPLIVILVLLSVALQWSVPKIRKALQSPFVGDKKEIDRLSEVKIGDFVSIKYYKIEHVIIVTEVHDEDDASRKGRICGVHYGLPSLFGTREVMEEQFSINLSKSKVKVYKCSHLETYAPETVVWRARTRVGETKWALTSNRSDHLCFWAKVKQKNKNESQQGKGNVQSMQPEQNPRKFRENIDITDQDDSSTKDLSSLSMGTTEIHLMDDLHLGEVIEYKNKTGILVQKKTLDCGVGRRFVIEMIVYGWDWYFCKKTYNVDLNKDSIVVKHYHPAHCYPMAVRKDRANKLEGTKGTWWRNKSFIEYCILLNP